MGEAMRRIHIYGDNILECEEALRTLETGLGQHAELVKSPLYAPAYSISINETTSLFVQLFPGYGRWSYDVITAMKDLGAKLREAPDAIITEVVDDKEVPLIAFEFSGALPAGNNAWQRCGRALGCAQAKIPYIYVAELGGIELDKNRNEKAGRLPNPIIPFAYYTLSTSFGSPSIVSYLPSPTINENHYKTYSEVFGENELFLIIRAVILHEDFSNSAPFLSLKDKSIKATQKLATARKSSKNSLSAEEWGNLSKTINGVDKAVWLAKKKMPWKKKGSIETTKSFKAMLKGIEELAVGVGSTDLPFALISSDKRKRLTEKAIEIYGEKITSEFRNWLKNSTNPLVVVFIAGFKPRGDDSRPDRGLTPLVRMIFGDNVDVLTLVYGPGKEQMWNQFNQDMWGLADKNGLWEAIVNLSNAILIDSRTCKLPSLGYVVQPSKAKDKDVQPLSNKDTVPQKFGEHDIDSVIHTLFSAMGEMRVFEGLCNPPGGNWSGVSLVNREESVEYRWSSLPRVSGANAKRPDHIFQINTGEKLETLLIIESKEQGSRVENKIGQRLIRYVSDLISIAPNINRQEGKTWVARTGKYLKQKFDFVSCAAFELKNAEELDSVHTRAKVDVTIGVEFTNSGKVIVHLTAKQKFAWLEAIFENAKVIFGEQIEVIWH